MNRWDFSIAMSSAGWILGSPRFLRDVAGDAAPAGSPRRPALRTGIGALDALLGGFRPGEVVVLAGPAGVGKTALAAQASAHISAGLGVPVAYFSLEDSSDDLRLRMACQLAFVDHVRERVDPLSELEARRLSGAREMVRGAPLAIDAWFPLDPGDFERQVRGRVEVDRADLVVVDHHPGLVGRGPRGREFKARLCRLAQELDVPILALTQARMPGGVFCGPPPTGDGSARELWLRRAGETDVGGVAGREAVLVDGGRVAGRARLEFDGRSGRFWSPGAGAAVREAHGKTAAPAGPCRVPTGPA